MCYFLVEGCRYTRSKLKYGLRLLLFSAVSELPFCMAFSEAFAGTDGIAYCGMNMIFTLFLCFCMVWALEDIENVLLKVLIVFGAFYLSGYSDWSYVAPMFTLMFQWAGKDEENVKGAFVAGCTAPGAVQVHGGLRGSTLRQKALYTLWKTWRGRLGRCCHSLRL